MKDKKPGRATGPRTPEGKARSSKNALKHGFRSRLLIINDGEHDEFNSLDAGLRAEVMPQGELEENVYQQLVRAAWDLRRCERKLASYGDKGSDPFDNMDTFDDYERFQRCHARLEGSFYRAQRELRVLQTNRILQAAMPGPLKLGKLPALANVSKIHQIAKRTHHSFESLSINTLIDNTDTFAPVDSPEPPRFTDHLTLEEKEKLGFKPDKAA
jgi:hypothetical protein